MQRDILQILEQDIGRLTKSQKKVAAYIIKDPIEAAFSTVEQIANQVQTSTTTIVRLTLFLGFSGYSEFQRELQELLKNRTGPSTRLEINFRERDKKNDIIKGIATQEIENLTKTFDSLSDDLILRANEALRSARQIYIIGFRSCFSVAHFLSYNLTRIFGNCAQLWESGGGICEQMNYMTDQDVLIAITMPRYIRDVVRVAQIAKEKSATVIAITDGPLSPLAECADILLAVECKTTGFHNSVTSAMLIAELLIGVSTTENPELVKTNLHNSEAILRRMNVHHNSSY